MQLDIKINGGGTSAEIAGALRQIAEDIEAGSHKKAITEKGECEWEDSALFTTITETVV